MHITGRSISHWLPCPVPSRGTQLGLGVAIQLGEVSVEVRRTSGVVDCTSR